MSFPSIPSVQIVQDVLKQIGFPNKVIELQCSTRTSAEADLIKMTGGRIVSIK